MGESFPEPATNLMMKRVFNCVEARDAAHDRKACVWIVRYKGPRTSVPLCHCVTTVSYYEL